MSMATKIVLMRDGVVQQDASPEEIYAHPTNRFTAQFIGTPAMNIFPTEGLSLPDPPKDAALVGFRPSRALLAAPGAGTSGCFSFEATVRIHEVMGSEIIYQAEAPFGMVSFKTFNQPLVEVGTKVTLSVDRGSLHFFDAQEGRVAA